MQSYLPIEVNGELFLTLDEDEEFLKELNLSSAFKRLVKIKVKQVRTFMQLV